MTRSPSTDDGDLVNGIAALEHRIETLVRWARVVRDLGSCAHDVSADGLAVIGEAMLADAINTKAGWQLCFDLACDGRIDGDHHALPPPDPLPARSGDDARGDPAEPGGAG